MRLGPAVLVCLIVAVSSLAAAAQARYQISTVESGIVGHSAILLDTTTGETWILSPEMIDGKPTGRDAWYVLERNTTLSPGIPRPSAPNQSVPR
jgi:hypothetical protein